MSAIDGSVPRKMRTSIIISGHNSVGYMVTHILSMILVETPAFMRLNASIEPLGPAPTTRTSTKLVWSVDCIFGDGRGGIGMGTCRVLDDEKRICW